LFVSRVETSFSAAHRLVGYPGKCAAPHGHTFRVEMLVATPDLDGRGLTVDFGDLKGWLRAWTDEHWDHGFLANDEDTRLIDALRMLPESKLYLFRGLNPSTEAMARTLFEAARGRFGDRVVSVRVWETPLQYAEYVPDAAPVPPGAWAQAVA
jgi:6-pyruvoyltetrahydropterin/6-carboxytetrahydropterin synthase